MFNIFLIRDRADEEVSRGDHRERRGRSTERQDRHSRSRSRSPPQRSRHQRYVFLCKKDIQYTLFLHEDINVFTVFLHEDVPYLLFFCVRIYHIYQHYSGTLTSRETDNGGRYFSATLIQGHCERMPGL